MARTVSVTFGENKRFDIELHERDFSAITPQSARRWLEQQFVDLGCEPTNPTGKTLVVDKILGVARAMGEKPFAEQSASAREFARNAIAALERNAVSIDVPGLSVG